MFDRIDRDPSFEPFNEDYQVLLGLITTFRVLAGNYVIFEEPEFPIVEFANQLGPWIENGLPNHVDFIYNSMESEIDEFFWFRWKGDRWQIGSDFAPFQTEIFVSDTAAKQAVYSFRLRLHEAPMTSKLRMRIRGLI